MEENNQKPACFCGSGEYIVLDCSGSCDLGLLTDKVARKLRDNKVETIY